MAEGFNVYEKLQRILMRRATSLDEGQQGGLGPC